MKSLMMALSIVLIVVSVLTVRARVGNTPMCEPVTMVAVPSGEFPMGRPYDFDGAGHLREVPVHDVFLDAYEIGKYPVTTQQVATVLTWALAQGYLADAEGAPYAGGAVFAYDRTITDTMCFVFEDNQFSVISTEGHGGRQFSIADHAMVRISWYGAAAFCNWLSEMNGYEPWYNTETWQRHEPPRNGYRLPTEAEWERAAAWDGEKHWRYGVGSDDLDYTRANFLLSEAPHEQCNPLGLTWFLKSSPVGWYNGRNPARLSEPEVLTVDSASPVGCYDMAGTALEWCQDWFQEDYYHNSPSKNPAGPPEGVARSLRSGTMVYCATQCRAAYRIGFDPTYISFALGFRVARSPL